ncbi:MAG: hypothetical protein N3A55_00820 [Methylohalobius sp.]|nr:hypothetical protein [Methylohalobius sp.]
MKIFKFLCAIMFAQIATDALAVPMVAKGNWDLVVPETANDFHMKIKSDTRLTLIGHYKGKFTSFTGGSVEPHHEYSATWSGTTLFPNEKVHIGLSFEMEKFNEINIIDAYWTFDGNKVGTSIPLAAFKVTPATAPKGGSSRSTLRLSNPSSQTMFFTDVSYSIGNIETPLDQLMFNPEGLSTPVPNFSIGPFSFFDVFVDLPLLAGDFVRLQGKLYLEDNTYIGDLSYEHEHGIPLPATIWLIVIGLASLRISSKNHFS